MLKLAIIDVYNTKGFVAKLKMWKGKRSDTWVERHIWFQNLQFLINWVPDNCSPNKKILKMTSGSILHVDKWLCWEKTVSVDSFSAFSFWELFQPFLHWFIHSSNKQWAYPTVHSLEIKEIEGKDRVLKELEI